MKFTKSTILVVSVLFLFVGNIGIDVFSHFCVEGEVSVSYFSENEDHCNDHHQEVDTNCCEEELDDDCCSDNAYHVQIKLDFFNQMPQLMPALVPISSLWIFRNQNEFEGEIRNNFNYDSPPPLISGRQLLLNKQNWII
ncbi:MAG: hypothetical protein JKY09_08215 [Crocinitomicaceae bacterium]|nr:hypothetical protein [Crocinitomicaceae bacterium]